MTCLIPLAALCLLQPADISIYADASAQVSGKDYAIHDNNRYYAVGTGHTGRFGIVAEPEITSHIQLRYGWEHTSFLDTNHDRGAERVFLGFTWKPFR